MNKVVRVIATIALLVAFVFLILSFANFIDNGGTLSDICYGSFLLFCGAIVFSE